MPPAINPSGQGTCRVRTLPVTSLRAGVNPTVIALWLGHEQTDTTMIYLHADLTLKQAALDRINPPDTTPGSYQPPDNVLAFLDQLSTPKTVWIMPRRPFPGPRPHRGLDLHAA